MAYNEEYHKQRMMKRLVSALIVNKDPIIYKGSFDKDHSILINPTISLSGIKYPKKDPVEPYIAIYLSEVYEPAERLRLAKKD